MAQARTRTGVISAANGKTQLLTETPVQSSPGKRVSWIPGQIPRSEEEKILHDALTKMQRLWTFGDLKDYLADTLYWRDFLRGGLVTDMSLLRMHYYREALETIKNLNGVLLTIEEE
jgi:hypothetical protein